MKPDFAYHSLLITHHFGEMAGAGGFEPTNAGSKDRCLTTWLRPNIKSEFKERTNEKLHRLSRAGIRSETL